MKRSLPVVLLLMPVVLSAQAPLKAFRATSDVSMRIWLPAGTVKVEVWDRDSIQVLGSVGRGAHLYAGGSGPNAKVGVEWDDHANTAIPHGDLVITVPRKAHVWIKMTGGDVLAGGTAGQLDVITVTGTISVHDASGVVSVETIDAGTTLMRISGDLRVRSGGGRVTMQNIHGTLTVATVNGLVDLSGVALQDARIETIGGPIVIHGTIAPGALLDLETHNGAIGLSLDRAAVPALTLTSRAGKIRNDLGAGSVTFGKLTAYSFKGDINVVPMTGIEARKANSPR